MKFPLKPRKHTHGDQLTIPSVPWQEEPAEVNLQQGTIEADLVKGTITKLAVHIGLLHPPPWVIGVCLGKLSHLCYSFLVFLYLLFLQQVGRPPHSQRLRRGWELVVHNRGVASVGWAALDFADTISTIRKMAFGEVRW